MNKDIQVTFQTIQKWSNLILFPMGIVMLLLSVVVHSGWMFLAGTLSFALWGAILCTWIVPTGFVGFIRNFGKLAPRSYADGLQLRIPIISETFLLCVMVMTKVIDDVKKTITRNNVDIKAVLTYQLEERYAYIVFKMMGENYFETHVSKWVDATFDTAVSKLSYPHFQAQKADVESWVSKLVAYELALKSSDMTEELVSEIAAKAKCSAGEVEFEVVACELVPAREKLPNPYKDSTNPAHDLLPDYIDGDLIIDEVLVGDGELEKVQRMELRETIVTLPGVNLFKNVSLKINEVKFEEAYEEARAQVAVQKAKLVETKFKAEKAREAARGIGDAKVIEAEAKKKELELLGEGEAKKITATMNAEGKALRENGELLRRTGLENIPLVVGNSSTLIDSNLILDKMEQRMGRKKGRKDDKKDDK